jgi:hypothetical protein
MFSFFFSPKLEIFPCIVDCVVSVAFCSRNLMPPINTSTFFEPVPENRRNDYTENFIILGSADVHCRALADGFCNIRT